MDMGKPALSISSKRWGIDHPCCKMWFPMVETSGTVIRDYSSSGIVYTPTALTFNRNGNPSVAIHGADATGSIGIAPTAGTIPNPGTKSFILFGVVQVDAPSGYGLFGGRVCLGDYGAIGKETAGLADTDAAVWQTGVDDGAGLGNSTWYSGNDSFLDPLAASIYDKTGCALVRDGSAFGHWIQLDWDNSNGLNDYAITGDILCGNAYDSITHEVHLSWRGPGDPTGASQIPNIPAKFNGVLGRNEYGWDLSPAATFGAGPTVNGTKITGATRVNNNIYTPSGAAVTNGLPGIWTYVDPAKPFPYENKLLMGLGSSVDGNPSWYGLALFVFDNGLPSDYKQALRWMRAQWIAGNKVLWPGWKGLS